MFKDWTINDLGDLVNFISGSGFPEHLQGKDVGEIPFYKVSDMSTPGNEVYLTKANNYVSRELAKKRGWKIAPAESVVFAKVGAALLLNRRRKLCVDSLVDNNMVALYPKEQIPTDWIYRQLLRVDFADFVQDGALPSVNQKQLAQIPIPLPSINEIDLITSIFNTLDTAIRETEAIIAKLKAVKQGLLHDLLTRGIDANGELRPPQSEAPYLYKHSPLGWIPKEWEISSVGKEFEIQLGKMLDVEKNTGVLKPYLGNKAVQWDRIDIKEVQQVPLSKSDMVRFRLKMGDLLVCEGGEVGRAAIWESQLDECYYQKALHRLRPINGFRPRLMLEFLRYWITRDLLSEFVSRTSIAHLTQEKLAIIPLPNPTIDEQDRLVAHVFSNKDREETESKELEKLTKLKSALMNDLLTGRVRVTPLLELS